MTYDDWEAEVPPSITEDPPWTVRVYRLALFAADLCWSDAQKLKPEELWSLIDQLYRAVGGIGAQIAEGYSRKTGKARARFYEDALGSAREGRHWYFKSRYALGPAVADHRLMLHAHIIRLLMTMVPQQRTTVVKEGEPDYGTTSLEQFIHMEVPF